MISISANYATQNQQVENTNKSSLNRDVGVIGLIMTLVGLLLLDTPRASIPLTSVGGSVLATALANWVLTRNLGNFPIGSIIEALAQKIEFMRTEQEAELTFTLHDDRVKLEKRHLYHLRNPRCYARPHRISMFTDTSPAADTHRSGFVLVLEPDGTKLEGSLLAKHVTLESGKQVFRKTYKLQPGDKNAFEFRSVDYYRLADRLIWTVQDLSENFRVRIRNQTGRNNVPTVKINHHCERDILDQMTLIEESNEIIFEFNAEILPYQGFEIMWDFSK